MSKSRLSKRDRAIHEQFSQYGKNAKEWIRKCALMLPQIEREEIWKKLGFTSIHHYSAVVSGMSLHQSREALRVVKRIENKPALMKIAEIKGINAVKPVATIATEANAEFWAEKAEAMSVHTLREYAKKSHNVMTSQPAKVAEIVQIELPPELARRLDRLRKREDFNELLVNFLDEVEGEEEAEKPDAKCTPSRYIPVKIRTFSINRTGSKCSFYGCNKPIHQLHHADRFALTKIHDPDRLVPLCKEHNELAHLGLVSEIGSPETWRILEKADKTSAKWRIDGKVQAFRKSKLFRESLENSYISARL